ncbi:MAG: hypothetical protein HW403_322 [Dehalococcoidia bacterium]|nr:hypothetical protein [Dehalococcoidia bacterium]
MSIKKQYGRYTGRDLLRGWNYECDKPEPHRFWIPEDESQRTDLEQRQFEMLDKGECPICDSDPIII